MSCRTRQANAGGFAPKHGHFSCGSGEPKGRDVAMEREPAQTPTRKGGQHMAKKAAKGAKKKGAKKR